MTRRLNATGALKAERSLRREQAIALRLAGNPFSLIAATLKVSVGTAHADVVAVLHESAARRQAAGDFALDLELERLDRLQAAAWDRALEGNLDAVRTCVAVIVARCKLLALEAPTKGEAEVSFAELVRIAHERATAPAMALREPSETRGGRA